MRSTWVVDTMLGTSYAWFLIHALSPTPANSVRSLYSTDCLRSEATAQSRIYSKYSDNSDRNWAQVSHIYAHSHLPSITPSTTYAQDPTLSQAKTPSQIISITSIQGQSSRYLRREVHSVPSISLQGPPGQGRRAPSIRGFLEPPVPLRWWTRSWAAMYAWSSPSLHPRPLSRRQRWPRSGWVEWRFFSLNLMDRYSSRGFLPSIGLGSSATLHAKNHDGSRVLHTNLLITWLQIAP